MHADIRKRNACRKDTFSYRRHLDTSHPSHRPDRLEHRFHSAYILASDEKQFSRRNLVCTDAFQKRQETPNHRLQACCEFSSQQPPILPSRSRQLCRGQIVRQANARLPPPRRPLREILPSESYQRVREAHRHKPGCRRRNQRRPPRHRREKLGCARRQLSEHVRCSKAWKSQPTSSEASATVLKSFPACASSTQKECSDKLPSKAADTTLVPPGRTTTRMTRPQNKPPTATLSVFT